MNRTSAICAAVLLLTAGCTSISNVQMNDELTSLYSAQLGARQSDDVIIQQSVVEAFGSLAARAAEAARAAADPADAVSFYRIAATAAWQGGLADVDELSGNGWAICERPDFDENRRDCVMLLVIPDLAATDALTAELDEQGRRAAAERRKPVAEQSPELLDGIADRTIDVVGRLGARFTVLDDARSRFRVDAVPAALLTQLHSNQDFIYCRIRDALGVLTIAAGQGDERTSNAQAAFTSIDDRHNGDRHVDCRAP